MVEDEVTRITIAIKAHSLALTTATLLGGWLPDEGEGGIHHPRVMKAVYLARDIVFDAETTTIARLINGR